MDCQQTSKSIIKLNEFLWLWSNVGSSHEKGDLIPIPKVHVTNIFVEKIC